jgi:hypothetical protein
MSKLLCNLPKYEPWVCSFMPINTEDFDLDLFPTEVSNCKKTETCPEVLKGFIDRGTRIIHEGHHFIVPYLEWCKLCINCRRSVHGWYYEKLYHADPEDQLPFELFDIEVEKEATIDLWQYLSSVMHFSREDGIRTKLQKTLEVDVWGSLEDIAKRYKQKKRQLKFTG